MRFRREQDQTRATTRRLLLLFGLTVLFTVAGVNLALALAWRLQSGGLAGYPTGFFETNTLVTLGFVLGGAWLESLHLRDGGEHVARMIGGREVVAPQDEGERRLRNIVDEIAIASGLKSPRVFVLDREDAINALAAGWDRPDSVIAVTRGALQRLTRDELQGVVAHEFAHILNGDTRLNMRLIGMVYGLQMIFNFGRSLMSPIDERGRRGPAVLAGLALVAVGSIGWLAGRLLKAGVSRQREHLADASAVEFTRHPSGIGNALRKVACQLERGQRVRHVNAEVVSHLLLSSDTLLHGGWLATHPPIEERVRRIFGRSMPPLQDDPVLLPQERAPELPPLEFAPAVGATSGSPVPDAIPGRAEMAPEGQEPSLPAPPDDDALLLALADNPSLDQLRAALLAFLLPPAGEATAELEAWRKAVRPSAASLRILHAIRNMPERRRLPWFERLLQHAVALLPEQRMLLQRDALAVVQADGQLSVLEYLQARVLLLQLFVRQEHPAIEPPQLHMNELAAAVTTVGLALHSVLAGEGISWLHAVLRGLKLPLPQHIVIPSVKELNESLERLALLVRTERPALIKQCLQSISARPLPPVMANAVRCLCLLIDTPLPPELRASFDPVPGLTEAQA